MATRARWLAPLVPLAALAAAAAVGLTHSPAAVLAALDPAGRDPAVVVGGLLVLYLLRPAVLWPLSVFSVFVGYLLGVPAGLPVALGGTLLSCLPPYLAARYVGERTSFFGRVGAAGSTVVDATGPLRGTVAARLSPAPADAVSYGAGVAGVGLLPYALGTLVGELPWAFGYVLLGASLSRFDGASVGGLDLRLVVAAALVALALVARPVYGLARRWRG